ncbi:uncharacterized protein METZ01_LOCUS343156 [marine metagenome]|uniref:Uncharacterized protein n=1 Tax=marine metagenome TaxID=408172 RepID=A0A382QZG9_9ZZZZ
MPTYSKTTVMLAASIPMFLQASSNSSFAQIADAYDYLQLATRSDQNGARSTASASTTLLPPTTTNNHAVWLCS